MKILSQVVFGGISGAVCTGICAAQEQTSAAPAAIEAKSIVQGKVLQDPGKQGIRKVKVGLRGGS